MAQVIWTEPVLQDIDQIADYISLDDPTAAVNMVKEIFRRVERLSNSPKMGKVVPEIEPSIYREMVVSPCRIFYRIKNQIVFFCLCPEGSAVFPEGIVKKSIGVDNCTL